ncbi:metabolite traffic protein EboE [Myxococcaceae bacterium GXIMD 01537]
MRLASPGAPHLTYCTNIHAGESWAEVRANVERHVRAVKALVAPSGRFGVGLRLGAAAARELVEPRALAAFQDFLREHGLYVFTLNGFPHGAFHGTRVKERVYLPDWLEDARLEYTDGLARLLAALLPDDVDLEGSTSTVPGAFRPRVRGIDEARAIAARLARHVALLHRLREETGKTLTLGLEPEPHCFLETAAEAVEFFRRHVFEAHVPGLSRAESAESLRRHLGLCLDACHLAVEYEPPAEALATIAAAGVRIVKLQLSAGLEVSLTGEPGEREALARFSEDVYLHQVVERGPDGRAGARWLDLPEALADAAREPRERQWRTHFHVPLHRERLGRLRSTQADLAELLARVRREPPCAHLEVETYTWDVLPPEHREADVAAEIARELRWVRDRLEGSGDR